MDTRKVQRTGKSTFIVSLPKNWAMKNGIHAGSIIYITQSDNGSLILSTDRSERDMRVRLDIGGKTGDALIRNIIGCYVAGYRTVDVTSSHMSSAQKKDVHQIVTKLVGPEILEESLNRIVIQDLLSSEELQAERALRRIRTVVKGMMQDAVQALVKSDHDLAADVMDRDDDVDRLNLLISRQFTEILRSGSVKQETLNPITAFNYMQASSNLERISDHASRIAETALKSNSLPPEEVSKELLRLEPIIAGLIDDSISYLLMMSSDKANELIEKAKEVQRSIRIIGNPASIEDKAEMLLRLVVAGSLERMLDYIKNIGELTINLRHANIEAEAS